MNLLDSAFVLLVLIFGIYGSWNGLRGALYTLVATLMAVLAMLLLGPFLESLVLILSGISPKTYPGAPGVAVLILEDQYVMAQFAAVLPGLFSLFLFVVMLVVGRLLRARFPKPGRSLWSRILGAPVGVLSGLALGTILAATTLRLPWPPAVAVAGESLLLALLGSWGQLFIPTLSGVM
ncbi:MAG: hypothetical protein MI717_01185 [Spirochaetales bacterium]|nr:hypothetical protein [Spirochaetales bacterium]